MLLWVYLFLIILLTFDQLVFNLKSSIEPENNVLALFPYSFYYKPVGQSLLFCFGIISLVFIIPLSPLVVLHLKNLWQDVTTYERLGRNTANNNHLSRETATNKQNGFFYNEHIYHSEIMN
jgi:hypothetical protein